MTWEKEEENFFGWYLETLAVPCVASRGYYKVVVLIPDEKSRLQNDMTIVGEATVAKRYLGKKTPK